MEIGTGGFVQDCLQKRKIVSILFTIFLFSFFHTTKRRDKTATDGGMQDRSPTIITHCSQSPHLVAESSRSPHLCHDYRWLLVRTFGTLSVVSVLIMSFRTKSLAKQLRPRLIICKNPMTKPLRTQKFPNSAPPTLFLWAAIVNDKTTKDSTDWGMNGVITDFIHRGFSSLGADFGNFLPIMRGLWLVLFCEKHADTPHITERKGTVERKMETKQRTAMSCLMCCITSYTNNDTPGKRVRRIFYKIFDSVPLPLPYSGLFERADGHSDLSLDVRVRPTDRRCPQTAR